MRVWRGSLPIFVVTAQAGMDSGSGAEMTN